MKISVEILEEEKEGVGSQKLLETFSGSIAILGMKQGT